MMTIDGLETKIMENCERLENIINLSPHFLQNRVYIIPDQYFLSSEDDENYTETTLSKLEYHTSGAIMLVNIWKKRFDRIIGFDLSSEGTELIFYTKANIYVYSFFNEIIEHVKDIGFLSLLPVQIRSSAKNVSSIMSTYSTLQTAQFIACLEDSQMFYFIVDINRDILLKCVELHLAQCCSWNMEFVYTLTYDGILCKYSSVSGDIVGKGFNIHTVIPTLDSKLQCQLLKVSCNNKDACLVDQQGCVYLFQIEEDQSDVETGVDICMELGNDCAPNSSRNESQSKKKWSFLDKIIKKNKQDEVCYVDSTPVQSTSSVSIMKHIIPDPRNLNLYSVEFLSQGLAVWSTDSSGGKYRIFSRDKGEQIYECHFNGRSCLFRDPTLKHDDAAYEFVATEQTLLIPIGCGLVKLDIEAVSSSDSSKWSGLLKLISSAKTQFLINDDIIIQILGVSFVHDQLDILEYCLDSHLNRFVRDVNDIGLTSSSGGNYDQSLTSSILEASEGMSSSATELSPNKALATSSRKVSTEVSSNMTSSGESGIVTSLLNLTGPESMGMLERMLAVVTQWESKAEPTFYVKCLERIISHLVHMAKLCNDRDSRKLSFEILKRVPPLMSALHVRCNHTVYTKAWNLLDSTQVLYLTLHSPLYRVQGGSAIPPSQVKTLLEECIKNRDFPLVHSVLNKMDYNIETELKSIFASTLNQQTRDFILNHVGKDLLDQQEYEAYTCYRKIHNALSRLLEQSNGSYDPRIPNDKDNEYQGITINPLDINSCDQVKCNKSFPKVTLDENNYAELSSRERDAARYDRENYAQEESKTPQTHVITIDSLNDYHDENHDALSHEMKKETKEEIEDISKTKQPIDNGECKGNIDEKVDKLLDSIDTNDICTDEKSSKKVALYTANLLRISFGEFKTYSNEIVMEIIAQLYFQSYDTSLLEHLTREICWKHLVESSMLEQLEAWIMGRAFWAESKQWTISQPMIDAVHTLRTTPATREFIMNKFCSVFGIFSSHEQSNILLIVSRLIQCQLLSKVDQVLCSATSNVSLEYFTTQLILLCIEREQWTLLSCLLESSIFKDLSLKSRSLKPVKLWSCLDATFNSPSPSPAELLYLISNVADLLDCAHDSNVNISKYFIATCNEYVDEREFNQRIESNDVVKELEKQFEIYKSEKEIYGFENDSKLSKSQQEISRLEIESKLSKSEEEISRLDIDSKLSKSEEEISGLDIDSKSSKLQAEIIPGLEIKSKLYESEEKIFVSDSESGLSNSHERIIYGLQNTVESSYPPELLTISSFYKRTLTSPDSTLQDINMSTLGQNNPTIDFTEALSRNYLSLKNQPAIKFQLDYLHRMKQGRAIASLYEKSGVKLLHDNPPERYPIEDIPCGQDIVLEDGVDLNAMYAMVLNSPQDSGLVTAALNVLRLRGVDEACLATQVRGVRCLNAEDIGAILATKQSNLSRSDLIHSIIEKCVSHCTDIQSWSPAVDLCKLYCSPLPVQLFDTLISENRWMEFLVACDVFNYADGDKFIHRFRSPTIRQHLKYALAHTLSPTDSAPDDLIELIECCHSNARALLDASLVHSVPCLALLASVLPSSDYTTSAESSTSLSNSTNAKLSEPIYQCLRVFLLACMEMKEEEEKLDLIQIMGLAVEKKCLPLLDDGLQMLLPDSPLSHFVSALCDFIMFDAQHTPARLRASIASLSASATISSHPWTVDALIFLTHKALSLLSCCAQRELLSTLRDADFNTVFTNAPEPPVQDTLGSVTSEAQYLIRPTSQDPLDIVLSIAQCLQRTDICVDFAQLWPTPSEKYARSILCSLLDRNLFRTAQEFCALSNLPTDRVVIAQWSERIAQEKFTSDLGFWKFIDEDFRSHSVSPVDAFEFFSSISSSIRSPVDRYKCLKLGLDRCDVIPAELYRQLYSVCLSEDFDLTCLKDVWGFNPTPAKKPEDVPCGSIDTTTGITDITVSTINTTKRTIDVSAVNTDANVCTTNVIINSNNRNIDSTNGTFDTISGRPDSTTLTSHPQSRLNLLAASMLDRGDLHSASLVSYVFHWEHPDCIVLKQMAKAATQRESGEDVLTQLCSKLRHGKTIGLFFVAAYRLLCSLDLSMSAILSTDPNLTLSRIKDTDLPLQCVQDLVCLASMQLAQSDIGSVIAEVVYTTLENGLHEEAVSNRLTLWGFDLHTEFSRYTSLCDSTELGLCLYYKAKIFLADPDIPLDTLRLTVELLIISHECFTSACNMEGVVSVLTQCRGLTGHLLAQSAWSLMVRLLIGVGRYVEMNYVYQLLKENQQFEFLLRKGYDKNPSFKLATLDFVRSDKNLFQLVALNFRLYAELATMFHSHADSMVAKLATSSERRLLCSESNWALLNDIIDNLTHAAQHFIQAQKLKQATSIVNQAELMSLQLDLLKSATGTSEDCLALFSIPSKDLTSVVAYHLTYQQAAVVLNAYDCPVDWSLVVHTQVIIRGNRPYLTAWLTNHRLSSNVVQDIVSRYQKEPKLSADMTSNMKYLISHVKPLELKYRVCSQLNFKDIVHSILGNPDVAWLKDTVWQVGYKQKGGLK